MSSGTDKIVSSIMSDAQEKADINIKEAEAKVSEIIDNANKTAEAEKTKILESGKKQSDMRYQQIISEAKMNARRAELGAKEEVIEASFKKATDDLKNIASSTDNEYVDSLEGMIKEAAAEIGGGDLIIHLKEEDVNKVKSRLQSIAADVKSLVKNGKKEDHLNLNSIAADVSAQTEVETSFEIGEPIDTIGGVIVKTKNGEIEVNNTIEARLLRYKKVLRSEVASVLFK